jgi:hypothetical protein
MTKIAGFGSGSISQRHGSADPDPHQNVMDPEHCATLCITSVQDPHWSQSVSETSIFASMRIRIRADPDHDQSMLSLEKLQTAKTVPVPKF